MLPRWRAARGDRRRHRRNVAWFAITEVSARRRSLVLRRLDLGSLETSDEHRLTLPARAAPSAREHAVRVHPAVTSRGSP